MTTATITHADMAKRVASRFLRAEDQQQVQAPAQQQGQQEQQALPQSGPGKNAVKMRLDEVNAAFEGGDEAGFHKAIDDLLAASKHGK